MPCQASELATYEIKHIASENVIINVVVII